MPGPALTPVCVWRVTPELVTAVDFAFGQPIDCYVNGSQVWLREDGPDDVMFEWRLHPVPGYRKPTKTDTYDVFADTALAIATGAPPPAPLDTLWDGLECFCAYDDEIEPAVLAAHAVSALGLPPDASGLVDHTRIGDDWENTKGTVSITELILAELGVRPV